MFKQAAELKKHVSRAAASVFLLCPRTMHSGAVTNIGHLLSGSVLAAKRTLSLTEKCKKKKEKGSRLCLHAHDVSENTAETAAVIQRGANRFR